MPASPNWPRRSRNFTCCADRVTPYEKVADILAVAQRAGVMKIAFVTEAAQ